MAGWQTDSEWGSRGYGRAGAAAFPGWLQETCGSLAEFHEAWRTVFSSQEYSDWTPIRPPNLTVAEPNLTRYDLFNADECFLTGTGAEVIPVVKIDGRVIGDGQPGAMTQRLIEKYHALTKTSGEPIYA